MWDDYIAAQREAIDIVRSLLERAGSAHAIGYCVAGTTLAATLAVMAAEGQADRRGQRDLLYRAGRFRRHAGELKMFVTDDQLALVKALSADGYLDGRYMAMTFNTLRSRDLIWNYVTSNYLLGQDYAAFDLLHWNGDTTNLPGQWHHELSDRPVPRQPAGRSRRAFCGRHADRPAQGGYALLCPGGGARIISPPPPAYGRSPSTSLVRCASCWRGRGISRGS